MTGTTDTKKAFKDAKIALATFDYELNRSPNFRQKYLVELNGYRDSDMMRTPEQCKAYRKHQSSGQLAYYTSRTLEIMSAAHIFPGAANELHQRVKLRDTDNVINFLQAHGHSPQRIAEGIFPPQPGDESALDVERIVLDQAKPALIAAHKFKLPALADVIEARRELALQKLAAPPAP